MDEVTGDLPLNDSVTGGAPVASTAYNVAAGPRPIRAGKGKKQRPDLEAAQLPVGALYQTTDMTQNNFGTLVERMDQQARGKLQADGTVGFSDKMGAAWSNEVRPLVESVARMAGVVPTHSDPEWLQERNTNWKKYFSDYSDEEQDLLAGATNREDYDHRVERVAAQREDAAVLATSGVAGQLGYGLAAGIINPVNWVAGIGMSAGVAKLGFGATKLALQGRSVAAAASNVTENVVGNVAFEGALQLMGEHKSMYDYGAAAMMGLIPSTVTAPLAYKQGQEGLAMKLRVEGEVRKAKIMQQAISNVGEDAPPAVIIAEAVRLEREQVSTVQRSAMTAAKSDDRIPAHNLDELPPEDEVPVVKSAAPEDAIPEIVPKTNSLESMVQNAQERGDITVSRYSPELTLKGVADQPAGVHLAASVADDPRFKHLQTTAEWLRKEFLPEDMAITLALPPEIRANGKLQTPNGLFSVASERSAMIGVKPEAGVGTLVHEVGHAIEKAHLPHVTPEMRDKVFDAYRDWFKDFNAPGKGLDALLARSPLRRTENIKPGDKASLYKHLLDKEDPLYAEYFGKFEEWFAESFGKYIEAGARGTGPAGKLALPSQIMQAAKDLFRRLTELFVKAEEKGLLRADQRMEDFFEHVRLSEKTRAALDDAELAEAMPVKGTQVQPASPLPPKPRVLAADAALATRNGLDLMPQGTPRERAEFKAVLDIYRQAEKWDVNNPTDTELLKSMLGNNDTFNVALPATIMAISPNPVARMVAGVLLENASGASGRRATAALSKYILNKSFIGHTNVEFDRFYSAWRNEVGGNAVKDHFNIRDRNAFNRAVASEIDARLHKMNTEPHALVAQAADSFEQAMERMRVAQVDAKVVGWARLPESSRGYMPHVLASSRIKEMTPDQLRSFTDVLSKQFQEIEGFDEKFAEELARTYLNHARVNAFGGHEIPANVHNPAAAEMVRGSLEAMGMTKEEVGAAMGRYSAGGASHTKKRLHLNLNQPFPNADGSMGSLLDLFNTDHLSLLKNYADRVSGEVALANHGVMGAQGLTLLRTALMHGPKDAHHEQVLKAFDQISAEMLGRPFGDARSQGMERLLTATAMAKLGGMGFPQFGESFNGVWAVGMKNTMDSILDMPRLIAEVHAIARGEKIENGVLNSMEIFGGGSEFGLDGYLMSTMHTNPEANYASYGHDSVSWIDRGLRTGAHVASVLSMHRAIHAAQVRGMSEQIVHKALKYIRNGSDDKALNDMGFTPRVRAAFLADMDKAVTRDVFGRIKSFDIGKISDIDAATEFHQAVVRGANQIIQGSFIGEQGRWVHSNMGRLLSQFRNFPLVALEKQWARNKGNHGVAGAIGIMVGSMGFALPVVLARIAFSAQGRADKDEYLAKQLDPMNLARASLNYVGSSGFAGEVMDMLSSAAGADTGGRKGGGSIVSSVLPAAGYIEDVGKAIHDPTDPYKVAKALPFSRTPVFLIGVNALKE